jgi:hypothetical protein
MVRGAPIKKRHGCYGKLGDEVEGGGLAGGLGEVVLAAEREAISRPCGRAPRITVVAEREEISTLRPCLGQIEAAVGAARLELAGRDQCRGGRRSFRLSDCIQRGYRRPEGDRRSCWGNDSGH